MARIPDPNGNILATAHPALVLRVDPASPDVWLVGITSSFTLPLPPHWIKMPWAVGGHPDTGLYKDSVLKCNWTVRFPVASIIRTIGKAPNAILQRAINHLVDAVNRVKRGEPKW